MVVVLWNKSEFYHFIFLLLKSYAVFLKRSNYLDVISEFSEPPNTVELAWMSLNIYVS